MHLLLFHNKILSTSHVSNPRKNNSSENTEHPPFYVPHVFRLFREKLYYAFYVWSGPFPKLRSPANPPRYTAMLAGLRIFSCTPYSDAAHITVRSRIHIRARPDTYACLHVWSVIERRQSMYQKAVCLPIFNMLCSPLALCGRQKTLCSFELKFNYNKEQEMWEDLCSGEILLQ